jgi:tetratricopeptide (TPR) repeat protein
MRRWTLPTVVCLCLIVPCFAQQDSQPTQTSDQASTPDQSPPRSDTERSRERDAEAGESSSRDTRIDTTAPKDDAKNHPNSAVNSEAEPAKPTSEAPSDVQELHPWNPYRAVKDDEVGDFYFKRKNYKAALARYQDALDWKENDAVATFRMAQCYEKLDQVDDAITHYQQYLKILPAGPFSKDARKALDKLNTPEKSGAAETPTK